MTDATDRRGRTPAPFVPAALAAVLALAACTAADSPSARPTSAGATPSAAATATPTPDATPSADPTPTPEPSFSLPLPDALDDRRVRVAVAPEVTADGGRIVVTVTSLAERRIDELVLRWPTELRGSLFLAPFAPTPERIAEGGPPLVQPWTKWVVGPGERGEPDGTTSLGWGPLDPGATLTIPLVVLERGAPGPVGFDLHLLAENALLSVESGEPAELRVEIP